MAVQELTLNPVRLDRNTGQQAMTPDSARKLDHIDLAWHPGIIRRGPGICRMNLNPPAFSVPAAGAITSCFVAHQRNGSKFVIVGTLDGKILLYPGDATDLDGGLLPLCDELADLDACCGGGGGAYNTGSDQSMDDDCGVSYTINNGSPIPPIVHDCPGCGASTLASVVHECGSASVAGGNLSAGGVP